MFVLTLVFIHLMCCSPTTVEPSVAEISGVTSQEEPVVLGVQRCRKEMRSPRYAIEPCILCQEQQEVRKMRPCDITLMVCTSITVSVFQVWQYHRRLYALSLGDLYCHDGNEKGVPKKWNFFAGQERKLDCFVTPISLPWYKCWAEFVLAGQQWWTSHRYGLFRAALDRVVEIPREDVRQRWRAGPAVHPRGSVLGRSCQ